MAQDEIGAMSATRALSWSGWPQRLERLAERAVAEVRQDRLVTAIALLDEVSEEVGFRREMLGDRLRELDRPARG